MQSVGDYSLLYIHHGRDLKLMMIRAVAGMRQDSAVSMQRVFPLLSVMTSHEISQHGLLTEGSFGILLLRLLGGRAHVFQRHDMT